MDTPSQFRGYRFSPELISHSAWLYHRFYLSFLDVEDLVAERGVIVSHEAIQQWCKQFGPNYANTLRKRGPIGRHVKVGRGQYRHHSGWP